MNNDKCQNILLRISHLALFMIFGQLYKLIYVFMALGLDIGTISPFRGKKRKKIIFGKGLFLKKEEGKSNDNPLRKLRKSR